MLFLGHIVADKILLFNSKKTNKQLKKLKRQKNKQKTKKNQINKQTDKRQKEKFIKKIAEQNQDEVNKQKTNKK